MRKLFMVAVLATSFFSSAAIAKTEGHYVGFNVIRSELQAQNVSIANSNFSNNDFYLIKDEDQFSVGANYKYAFNFNDFFIAPAVFFDYSNISTEGKIDLAPVLIIDTEFNIDHRLGLKLDAGYDITDKFAIYGNVGLVNNFYRSNVKITSGSNSLQSSESGSDISVAYGIGIKYSVLDNMDLNLEYEKSEIEMDLNDPILGDGTQEFDLNVIKLGVSYKF